MKTFDYGVKEQLGIHARPAVMLAMECKRYESKIIISLNGKNADASDVVAIMGLNIKFGDTIRVEVTGKDEDMAYDRIKDFFFHSLTL